MKATITLAAISLLALAACAETPTTPIVTPESSMLETTMVAPMLTLDQADCPPDFALQAYPQTEVGVFHPADRNRDFVFCEMITASGHVVQIDNAWAGHLGSCPVGFSPGIYKAIEDSPEARRDRNGNGILCFKWTPSGERVLVDDSEDEKAG